MKESTFEQAVILNDQITALRVHINEVETLLNRAEGIDLFVDLSAGYSDTEVLLYNSIVDPNMFLSDYLKKCRKKLKRLISEYHNL